MNAAQQASFNRGKNDGKNSAGFKNPIHNNWKLDKSNKVVHFDREYLDGYCEGYRQASSTNPICFPSAP